MLSLLCIVTKADTGSVQGPSDGLRRGRPSLGVDFVYEQLNDLRSVYCDLDVLKRRKNQGVCYLDSKLGGMWKDEVTVTTNSTVATVFQSIGFTNWNGGRQIRLIKKNEIIQSGFPRPLGSSNWTNFLNLKIDPADILILCPME